MRQVLLVNIFALKTHLLKSRKKISLQLFKDYDYPEYPSFSYLMQSRTHDRYKKAIVEVVQELGADQRMSNLYHSVAELQRVHEQH